MDEELSEILILQGVNDEEEKENTTETIDYTQLLDEIITNQENIIAQTESINNNLVSVNNGLFQIFHFTGILVVIALLVIVCRYIQKIFIY